MEGIGVDNVLGAEEVEKLFSSDTQNAVAEEAPKEKQEEAPVSKETEKEETAEVDFTDLLGNIPESVGSEEDTGRKGDAPESSEGSGTPQPNLFSSIAKALRDEGVFPDLSDDTLKDIKDAAAFRKLFDDEVSKSLDERQQRLEKLLNSGAPTEEIQAYNNDLSISDYLNSKETYETLLKETEEGENLRKQVMFQDYLNRGFSRDRAIKMVNKSVDDGNDMDDAKEALEACKEFYANKLEAYHKYADSRKKQLEENTKQQSDLLKKMLLDTESFYGGVKADKHLRQKAYDSITKPEYKDEDGNYMTALQKYQRENPMDFMVNMALLFSLTDGFKNVDRLTKEPIKAGLKKGFAELESVLNTSRRNNDGTLNLANTAPDDSEREKWTLAF
jgi:hypothetical protein